MSGFALRLQFARFSLPIRWLKTLILTSSLSLAIATSAVGLSAHADAEPKAEPEAEPAAEQTTEEARPKVKIETTKGTIVMEVFTAEAPLSATNFLKLVDEGFYDGLIFHRVVANFVVQTGGYNATLTYRTPPGTIENESGNGIKNTRGTVAMARQTDPDSADAQFFINMRDNPHLDPVGDRAGYSVFGKVIAGMDAAERIELSDTNIQAGMAGVPEHPIEIIAVTRLP